MEAVRSERAAHADESGQVSPAFTELYAQHLAEAENRYRVVITLTQREWNTKLHGELDEILESDELDLRRITAMEIAGGDRAFVREPRCTVKFSHDGVDIRTTGEPAWIRSTSAEVKRLLERSVPWWSRLRTAEFAILAATVLLACTLILLGGLAIRDSETNELATRQDAWFTYVFGGSVAIGLVAGGVYAITRFILPGFEIVSTEHPSRGGRAMAVVGALVIGVVGSIIASLLIS